MNILRILPAVRRDGPSGPVSAALLILALLSGPAALAPSPAESQTWRLSAPGPARDTATGQHSSLRLLPGWATEAGGRVAGLWIGLHPGWKTYWRVPGESGIPPQFDWSASENVAEVAVRWPAPQAFESFGMTTIGYHDEVTLPLEVTPEDPSRPIRLRLTLAYGVCEDICIPEMADLALDLAPRAETSGGDPISAAMARLPRAAADAGAVMEACGMERGADGERLAARIRLARPPQGRALAVVEAPEPMWFQPAEVAASGADLSVTARLDPASRGWLDRSAVRVTVMDEAGAVELHGCGG